MWTKKNWQVVLTRGWSDCSFCILECSLLVRCYKKNLVPDFNHLVYILHRLAEDIWPYKVDQINADPKTLILTSKKEELSVNSTGIRGLKCNWIKEVLKFEEELDRDVVCHQFYLTCTAYTIPRKFLKGLETQNRRTSNSHCEICRWPCATS